MLIDSVYTANQRDRAILDIREVRVLVLLLSLMNSPASFASLCLPFCEGREARFDHLELHADGRRTCAAESSEGCL